MFPPQGLPQPGAGGLSGGGSAGGGGTLPPVALQVLLENYKSTRRNYMFLLQFLSYINLE